MVVCNAKKANGNPCHFEESIDGLCTIHFIVNEKKLGNIKEWKNLCKVCNRPRILLPGGYCRTCKTQKGFIL